MKLLNGQELAQYIKERQRKDVQTLILNHKIKPKLAIIVTIDNPIINLYISLKQKYGDDIKIEVEVFKPKPEEVKELIAKINKDQSFCAIIIQLPIFDPAKTEEIVNLVDKYKDVDALSEKAIFDPATPMAILWLLSGYNIDLNGKKVLLIGKGKLVGMPLYKMLKNSQIDVSVADRSSKDLKKLSLQADVIITATGSPAILFPDMFKENAVVVDAGVASEDGKVVGDLDESVYEREDLVLTPKKGGVGPLTVSALFENVIRAAQIQAKTEN